MCCRVTHKLCWVHNVSFMFKFENLKKDYALPESVKTEKSCQKIKDVFVTFLYVPKHYFFNPIQSEITIWI